MQTPSPHGNSKASFEQTANSGATESNRDEKRSGGSRSSARERAIPRGRHHARYFDGVTPMHLVSKVFQGRYLLVPAEELNQIILGVMGRAQQLYPDVELYAFAFMSNHMHAMATGPGDQLAAFMGFIKREISRRWGPHPLVGWSGTMWGDYKATALPTHESQIDVLRYVLSQGTKEHLVERPQDWPGVHCVHALMSGQKMSGKWCDFKKFGLANRRSLTRKKDPKPSDRTEFETTYELKLAVLPALADLNEEQRQAFIADTVRGIEEQYRAERVASKTRVLGVIGILKTKRTVRSSAPVTPWYELRRRMVVWAKKTDTATRVFVKLYWHFQREFHAASLAFCNGNRDAAFPPNSFTPGRWLALCDS